MIIILDEHNSIAFREFNLNVPRNEYLIVCVPVYCPLLFYTVKFEGSLLTFLLQLSASIFRINIVVADSWKKCGK
jgi:hypothetical protein